LTPPSRGDEASCVAAAVAGIEARRMPGLSDSAIVPGLERLVLDALSAPGAAGGDRLRLLPAPLVPEVRLLLAEDAILLWARLEAEAGHVLPPPFWASAWTGGQALARYVLDHPDTVAGRRVLDIASGSGLVAIAAAIAGAAAVTANDVDPYAIAAISANADANGVDLIRSAEDLLDGDGDDVELVLAGDVLYNPSVAARMLPYLARVAANGGAVLVGDPDRGHLPDEWLEPVASYDVPGSSAPEDAQLNLTSVLRARRGRPSSRAPAGREMSGASR
jgi:predicted nicotinamide N-methyase